MAYVRTVKTDALCLTRWPAAPGPARRLRASLWPAPSAGTFGISGIFASALLSSGWSPAGAAIARLAGSAILLAVPAVVQLRGRWALLRREAGRVLIFGLVVIAGGQLFYFNAIKSLPIGIAVLLEYFGVVLIVGWLWAVRGQRPGRLTAARAATAIAGLALLADLAGSAQLSPVGIMWGMLEAVGLAVYFLLSATVGKKRSCRRWSWPGAGCASAQPSSPWPAAPGCCMSQPAAVPRGVHRRRVHARRCHPGAR